MSNLSLDLSNMSNRFENIGLIAVFKRFFNFRRGYPKHFI